MEFFDIVLGVDRGHLEHLETVLPNWLEKKPSLSQQRFVIFYDEPALFEEIRTIVGSMGIRHLLVPWKPSLVYESNGDKWTDPQRQMMLAGFVYVAAEAVATEYYLKLDLDVVAEDTDNWIDTDWFASDRTAIISHPWGYTKPPNQMLELDAWAAANRIEGSPLNLAPNPGSDLVKHNRIISWCAFFNTEFTRQAAMSACSSVGYGKLPVPSQDGFLWYLAERTGWNVIRTNMKARGWIHRSRLSAVKEEIVRL